MKHIPVHLLKNRTSLGFQLKRFEQNDQLSEDPEVLGAHRDDHYIFFVMEKGEGHLMIDFNEINLAAGALYYILPGQVHHRIRNEAAEGWFIAVDTALVPPECRNVFESQLLLQQAYTLSRNKLSQCHNLLMLLFEKYKEEDTGTFYITAIRALLQSFLAIAAGCYNGYSGMDLKVSRPAQLTGEFKSLLVAQLRSIKSPAEYAARLNVSESYLSEVLKKTTGFPVSYWIHQEVMMEAKRLLYYSRLTVKEVAYDLGYIDHSYFSRLFRKVTGNSAVNFRDQYRK